MMILGAALGVAYVWLGVRLWQRIVMRPLDMIDETDLIDRLWLEQRVHSLSPDAICVWLTFVLFWPLIYGAGFFLSRLSL